MFMKIKLKDAILLLSACISYFVLEPVLTQLYIIRAFSIVYYPYLVFRCAAVAASFIIPLIMIKNKKICVNFNTLIPVVLLYLCYLVPTVIYSKNFDVWLTTVVPILAYYILIIIVSSNENLTKQFIHVVSWIYVLLAAINLVFIIKPQLYEMIGSYSTESFISTIENLAGFPLCIGLLFVLLNSYFSGNRVQQIIYITIYIVSMCLMWTAAQILGMIAFLVYLIPWVRKHFEKIDILIWPILSIAMFIILVWFWEPIKNFGIFKVIIEDVLKKDLSFSGRVHIWQGIADMTKDSILIGHGLLENPQYMFFDTEFNNNWVHAHNAFLQTLYEGGIISLIALVCIFVYTSKKVKNAKSKKLQGIFNIIIVVLLLNLEMDQFFVYPWRSSLWCSTNFLCIFCIMVKDYDN